VQSCEGSGSGQKRLPSSRWVGITLNLSFLTSFAGDQTHLATRPPFEINNAYFGAEHASAASKLSV
jgi:hypothetical protein